LRKRILVVLLASAFAAASVAVANAAAQPDASSGYIVMLRPGVDAKAAATKQAREHNATIGHIYSRALRGYSAHMSASAAARLARDPQVLLVQPDGAVTTSAQSMPTGIDRADAELSPTAAIDGADTRVGVDVAVIDTGIDLSHPDLNVHAAGAKNCSSGKSANDGNGHGTHVAGTVGALDNGAGVVGMAPGARLWPVRVLNNAGSGSFSDVICGVDYVTAHASEIEVANMSLGGPGSDSACGSNQDALHEAICAAVGAGVTFVVSAGNSAADARNFVPATYDEVITVSALADFNGKPGGGAAPTCRADVDDTIADFSNFGADVDVIAPGVCILSTWRRGGYNTISGTSMASPHVAGGAALYKATHPTASPADVKSALQAVGTTNWSTEGDRDGIQEKLLNVATF
jgi:subtilisin family serine protease